MDLIHQIALLLAISICFLNLANVTASLLPGDQCFKCNKSNKSYCFHPEFVTFDDALELCVNIFGTRLSTIQSREEHECFREAIAPIALAGLNRAFWTSGSNSRSPGDSYVWESIHQPVEQEFWASHQRQHPEQNCIAVSPIPEYNNWFKEACTNRFSYFCERSF